MSRLLEPVETYATLFRWAATYSLLLTDDSLIVARVGPAMGAVGGAEGYLTETQRHLHSANRMDGGAAAGHALGVAAAAPVLEKVEARYGQKVAEGLARLHEVGHDVMAEEKGSFRFALSEITSFAPGSKGALDTMDLKTSGRDFQFKVSPGGEEAFRSFAEAVMASR